MRKHILTYIFMAAMLLTLAGCGNSVEESIQPVEKAGTILISLTPEIELEYDREGLVMNVIGLNDEGKFISAEQGDLIGLPCKIALETLIKDIFEAGYFSSDVGGPDRTILLKLEKGSVYHKGFLQALEETLHETASACGLETITMTIDENIVVEKEQTIEDLVLHQLQLPAVDLTNGQLEGASYSGESISDPKS